MSDLAEAQYLITERVCAADDVYGLYVIPWQLAETLNVTLDQVLRAIELLARRGLVDVRREVDWEIRPPIDPGRISARLLAGLPWFRLFRTSQGIEWLEAERSSRLPRTGDETGDLILAATLIELQAGNELPTATRARCGRVLSALIRIAAMSYRDSAYLAKPAQRALDAPASRSGTRQLEVDFYQPLLHAEFLRDPVLALLVTKGSEQAAGRSDLLIGGDIPVEAKVIYPDHRGGDAELIGIAQTAQYAARSGVGFLAVLDMRCQRDGQVTPSLREDVRVVEPQPKTGARVVRVRHLAGLGPPSRRGA